MNRNNGWPQETIPWRSYQTPNGENVKCISDAFEIDVSRKPQFVHKSKRKICRESILSTVLYGAEIWGQCTWVLWRSNMLSWWDICGQSWRSNVKTRWLTKTFSSGKDSLIWKTSSSERISIGQYTFWGCQLTACQCRFSTYSYDKSMRYFVFHPKITLNVWSYWIRHCLIFSIRGSYFFPLLSQNGTFNVYDA